MERIWVRILKGSVGHYNLAIRKINKISKDLGWSGVCILLVDDKLIGYRVYQ